jgi:hypothetical protein
LEQNPSYEQIEFKEDYTIQFPSGFTGNGLEGGLGVRFNVQTVNGAELYYEYLCATDCWIYFGETLDDPLPDEIDGFPLGNNEKLLKSTEFCINEDLVATLYQSNTSNQIIYAKLYMKVEGEFKEGLRLNYTQNDIDEVESILKTISEI